jgi:hypothetical protein
MYALARPCDDHRSNFGRPSTSSSSSTSSGDITSTNRRSRHAVMRRPGPASGFPMNADTRTLGSTTARIKRDCALAGQHVPRPLPARQRPLARECLERGPHPRHEDPRRPRAHPRPPERRSCCPAPSLAPGLAAPAPGPASDRSCPQPCIQDTDARSPRKVGVWTHARTPGTAYIWTRRCRPFGTHPWYPRGTRHRTVPPLKHKIPANKGYSPARPERFELPTFGSVDRRSIQLS